MTELIDAPSAFGYGDSILVGDRVGLRGALDDDVATLARWDMDPGRLTTLTNRVAEGAADRDIFRYKFCFP